MSQAHREPPSIATFPVVRVLLPFAGAYVLSYLYRTVNAVIAPDLVTAFALSASDLGLLTSAYFFSFAAFQLPLGLLLDRFGPRRTDAALLVIAAIGAMVFSTSHAVGMLAVGRALIGLGVSGCLMSGIKANVLWFPMGRLASVNGWLFFAGGLGMVAATVPVEFAVEHTDWQTVFLALAALTIAASMMILLVVPERPGAHPRVPISAQLAGLRTVFSDAWFWRIAVAAGAVQSTNMAIQGLWAGPWLRDVAGLDRDAVAAQLLAIAVSTTAGFAFWGNFAVRLEHRGVSMPRICAAGMGISLVFQVLIALQAPLPTPALWCGFGFFGTAGSLVYAFLPRRFPLALAGRVNTALNSLVFSWAFVVQWGIGAVISLSPRLAAGFPADAYRPAFCAFVTVEVLAWLGMLKALRARLTTAGAD
ncbi:MAG: MFS transporter [Proteobacteria bacterium]|nr:MAG: MFS transporter [Pseudomonadota bacterium]